MIITCKECSTSFNLDDSLVKESGSKCSCSVCKHIFMAYPLPLEKDQESEKSPIPVIEPTPYGLQTEEDFSLEEDNDLDIEPSDFEMDAPVPEADEGEFVIKMEDEVNEGLDDALITEDDEFKLEKKTIEIDDFKEEDVEVPQEEVEPVLTPAPGSRRRKKKSRIGTPVLLLLIFLLVAGAYIASIMTGYKIPYISDIQIPFIEQYLKKPASEIADVKPLPNQKSVDGRFVTNSIAGTLFVITGKVENPSNIAYKHIQISGALITKSKQEAKIKNAYCGNIISEDMLKTGNIADINQIMAVKTGNNNLNANIKPKTSIPFMIVFSDLPDKLENFTVKVNSFEKVKTN